MLWHMNSFQETQSVQLAEWFTIDEIIVSIDREVAMLRKLICNSLESFQEIEQLVLARKKPEYSLLDRLRTLLLANFELDREVVSIVLHASELQQLLRVRKGVKALTEGVEDLVRKEVLLEILSQRREHCLVPNFLIFEFESGYILRKSQLSTIHNLEEKALQSK